MVEQPSCIRCVHSSPRKPSKTYLEEWEQDTRPERPKGFLGALKALFKPDKYKGPHPYTIKGRLGWCWAELHDAITTAENKHVICQLLPEHVSVPRKHFCAGFIPKTSSDGIPERE
jgi:hypothetical protein